LAETLQLSSASAGSIVWLSPGWLDANNISPGTEPDSAISNNVTAPTNLALIGSHRRKPVALKDRCKAHLNCTRNLALSRTRKTPFTFFIGDEPSKLTHKLVNRSLGSKRLIMRVNSL
jgi:hypothetical protein